MVFIQDEDALTSLCAHISESIFILDEQSVADVEKAREATFEKEHEEGPNGSFYQQWFKKVSQGDTAVKTWGTNNKAFARRICWKKGSKFEIDNLFSYTMDTSRVLPMALADFRVQWYYHPNHLKWIDSRKNPGVGNPRKFHQTITLSLLLFPILVMRNMHDFGGGDVPIIILNWSTSMLDRAFQHWVEASESDWTHKEALQRREKLQAEFLKEQNCLPCFLQVDLHIRALLQDEDLGYIPRFIVFRPTDNDLPGRALFVNSFYQPPAELVKDFPSGCGSTSCTDPDCLVFDFSACRALAPNPFMIRKNDSLLRTVRCNFWPCGVQEEWGSTGPSPLARCQRCKEVMYCGREHQKLDWAIHKRVCETHEA